MTFPGIEKLRLAPLPPISEELDCEVASTPRRQGQFLKGPIAWDWLTTACRLPYRAVKVALALWFQSRRKNSQQVSLTGPLLSDVNVTRHTLHRALEDLEAAKLIHITQRTGKSPLIELLPAAASSPDTESTPTTDAPQAA